MNLFFWQFQPNMMMRHQLLRTRWKHLKWVDCKAFFIQNIDEYMNMWQHHIPFAANLAFLQKWEKIPWESLPLPCHYLWCEHLTGVYLGQGVLRWMFKCCLQLGLMQISLSNAWHHRSHESYSASHRPQLSL